MFTPVGLFNEDVEFFEINNQILANYNKRVLPIESLPVEVISMIEGSISIIQNKALVENGYVNKTDKILQFIKCNFSVYDFTPDVVNGQLNTEYVKCDVRHNCPFAQKTPKGRLCKTMKLSNCKTLTFSELDIISKTRAGLLDKEIADELHVSMSTVATHKQNIQMKLGIERKTQIAIKAIELGIA